MKKKKHNKELPEDIEVIKPGQLLKEAREDMGLSLDDVSKKLHLRQTQLEDIENNQFDVNISPTFTKGYLRSYGRLVGVDEDVLFQSFEYLNIAEKQYAEMQSFSKRTAKEASDNRLMAFTYLIAFVIVASSVLYWTQMPKEQLGQSSIRSTNSSPPVATETKTLQTATQMSESLVDNVLDANANDADDVTEEALELKSTELVAEDTSPSAQEDIEVREQGEEVSQPQETLDAVSNDQAVDSSNGSLDLASEVVEELLVDVEFVFNDDCYIEVTDGTGEAIAYGIKRAGYRMTIAGKPDFNVKLGAQCQLDILYDGAAVDLSNYPSGSTRKFTLPLQD